MIVVMVFTLADHWSRYCLVDIPLVTLFCLCAYNMYLLANSVLDLGIGKHMYSFGHHVTSGESSSGQFPEHILHKYQTRTTNSCKDREEIMILK